MGKPTKATELPTRFRVGFAWKLDGRSEVAREVMGDLMELWQSLGGLDQLSPQEAWLCERVVFMRHRMLAYETAVLAGTEPPMTAGEFSNFANVCQGHLKSLGLSRRAKPANGLQAYLASKSAA